MSDNEQATGWRIDMQLPPREPTEAERLLLAMVTAYNRANIIGSTIEDRDALDDAAVDAEKHLKARGLIKREGT